VHVFAFLVAYIVLCFAVLQIILRWPIRLFQKFSWTKRRN